MTIITSTITTEAQVAFNKDMTHGYTRDELERYTAEAGWQDWMEEFVDGEEATQAELKRIEDVQREMFNNYWTKIDTAIHEAEVKYHGDFVPAEKITIKPDTGSETIRTFELDGDIYEYTDRWYNGETFKAWRVSDGADFKVTNVAIEVDEDEWQDLGIVIFRA